MRRFVDLFAADFKATPYWWDNANPPAIGDVPLPAETDFLIIGSGYTGLHAAIQTVRAGHSTLVIDAEAAGWGCSTRNGGQISTSVKPGFPKLKKRYGEPLAREILSEGQASLDFVEAFIRQEKLDCDFANVGRFHGAHTVGQYEKLARECANPSNPVFDTQAFMVPQQDQHKELGTNAYHGGVVFPKHASVDPARYHSGLLEIAQKAGVQIVPNCRAESLDRVNSGHLVKTDKGPVKARKVIIATNGYSGILVPWLRHRTITIGSYIIATEELPKTMMDRLFPTNRILSDTRKLVYYYRPTPDRKRVLFGGRVSLYETDPLKSGPKLHRDLAALFPELGKVKIHRSWAGFVAYTFDELMHIGTHDGLYFSTGYCGAGVGMASYLGMRIGRQAAEIDEKPSAFAKISFNGRPYYNGVPWFLAPSVFAYRMRDKLGI